MAADSVTEERSLGRLIVFHYSLLFVLLFSSIERIRTGTGTVMADKKKAGAGPDAADGRQSPQNLQEIQLQMNSVTDEVFRSITVVVSHNIITSIIDVTTITIINHHHHRYHIHNIITTISTASADSLLEETLYRAYIVNARHNMNNKGRTNVHPLSQ